MIKIRLAELTDLKSIQEILNDQIINTCNVYYESPRTESQMKEWFHSQSLFDNPILVAESDKKVLGYATYSQFRRWEGFRFCVEHSIYLSEALRGKGIGKLLLSNLLEVAKDKGIHSMIAGIDGQNIEGIEFHKKQDFVQVAEILESGFKFNQWRDLILMQRILK